MTTIKREIFQTVCNGCGNQSEWSDDHRIPEGWKLLWATFKEDDKEYKNPGHFCPQCLLRLKGEKKDGPTEH